MPDWNGVIRLMVAAALVTTAQRLTQKTTVTRKERPNSSFSHATSNGPVEQETGSTGLNNANGQRSNAKNPNNAAFKSAGDNRSNQMNPNNTAYRSSRGR